MVKSRVPILAILAKVSIFWCIMDLKPQILTQKCSNWLSSFLIVSDVIYPSFSRSSKDFHSNNYPTHPSIYFWLIRKVFKCATAKLKQDSYFSKCGLVTDRAWMGLALEMVIMTLCGDPLRAKFCPKLLFLEVVYRIVKLKIHLKVGILRQKTMFK